MLIPTPAFQRDMLAVLAQAAGVGAVAGPLNGLFLALSAQTLPEGVDLVYADNVIEPAYAGYANLACAFGAPFRRTDGKLGVDSGLLSWQQTGALTSVTVVAVALYLPGTLKTIYAVENLALPKALNTALDALKLVVSFGLELSSAGETIRAA